MSKNRSWTPDDPVFKYVRKCDAHYLRSGSLRIGTFRGYARLEGPRQDEGENTFLYDLPNMYGTQRYGAEILSNFGWNIGDGNVIFSGNMVRVVGDNRYCFCTSYRSDLPDAPNEPQSVFRIANVRKWVARLGKICTEFNSISSGQVFYRDRRKAAGVTDRPVTYPFVKPLAFSLEHEVRFVSNVACSEDASDIYTNDDDQLALLMEEIR